jgi:hypothetical protein
MQEQLQAWFDLQSATLRRVHASWVGGGIPPDLIDAARRRSLGRRWLAQRICTRHPLLFELPARADDEAVAGVHRARWLEPVLQDSQRLALELGALALAPTLRTLVSRSAVVSLRQALGPVRYERMLATAAATPGTGRDDDLAASAESGGDIVERVTRCGAWELAEYAEHLHPAWGESVRLTFERGWWRDVQARRFSDAAMDATLRAHTQPSEPNAPGAAS